MQVVDCPMELLDLQCSCRFTHFSFLTVHRTCFVRLLLVHVNHLLHLVVASQEDARAIVDVLRHHMQHALHLAIDRLAAS
jgi:hypothetical protein